MPKDDEADRAISGLKDLVGVELDRDLALALGIDASAVSAWRKRGTVPEKYRLQAQRLADEGDAESPVRPSYFALRSGYIFALIGVAAIQLDKTAARLSPSGDDVWYGFRLFKLHAELERLFSTTAQTDLRDRDGLRLKYNQLQRRIAEGDLIGWIESLPSPS